MEAINLTQQYQALEAEMLATPKSNSHRRSLLVAQMKEIMKQIKNHTTMTNEDKQTIDKLQAELDKLKAKLMDVPKPTKRGFTWEDSFSGEGAYVRSHNSEVCEVGDIDPLDFNKCVFRNTDYAKSSLAYAQLTHIVEKYNEGKERGIDGWVFCIAKREDNLIISDWGGFHLPLPFYTVEDAETSLEVNRKLWEQFWMLK
jgi:hypothetical protein